MIAHRYIHILCIATACLLCSAAVEAQTPYQRLQLHLDGSAAFIGDLSVNVLEEGTDKVSFDDKPLAPSFGGYLGASLPIGRWFTAEAGAALLTWRTEEIQREGKNREKLIDLIARPRARVGLGLVELYAVIPVGLTVPLIADDTATNLRIEGAEVSRELGWTIGAAIGVQAFVVSSHVGVRAELGYQKHSFGYSLDDVVPATSFEASFHQLLVSIGIVYAL